MGKDILKIIDSLGDERYRTLIIHAPPESGPMMSKFGQRIAEVRGGSYVDLLDYFIENQELSAQIDRFGPEKFKEMLIELSKGERILVINRADFLIDTWRKKQREAFMRLFQNQWDSYRKGMQATLVFCLQSSHDINTLTNRDPSFSVRVMHLSELDDIG